MRDRLDAATTAALSEALGAAVRTARPLTGGDINQAFALELADGRRVFAKSNSRAPAGMFSAEARGLAWLADAGALRVPQVLAVGEPGAAAGSAAGFLVLELIEPAARRTGLRRAAGAWPGGAAPGRGGWLRARSRQLHRLVAAAERADGGLPRTGPSFYRSRRLEPLLARAAARGLASPRMRRGFDRLFENLDDLVGPPEPPARLHGDLWGGNLLVDGNGDPCLIDPAVYGGHREIDLAMMRLFGGFDRRTFAAYDEAYPLAAGVERTGAAVPADAAAGARLLVRRRLCRLGRGGARPVDLTAAYFL